MTVPKDYLPREGDVVAIRGRVRFDVDAGENGVHVLLGDRNHHSTRVPLSAIADIIERHWKPGEWAVDEDGEIVQVIMTDGGYVWVRYRRNGNRATCTGTELRPARAEADAAFRARIEAADVLLAEEREELSTATGAELDRIGATIDMEREIS